MLLFRMDLLSVGIELLPLVFVLYCLVPDCLSSFGRMHFFMSFVSVMHCRTKGRLILHYFCLQARKIISKISALLVVMFMFDRQVFARNVSKKMHAKVYFWDISLILIVSFSTKMRGLDRLKLQLMQNLMKSSMIYQLITCR